ncbi:hypothetical protein CFBP5875_07175 [Agrobacterium pusense]|uniref:Uncharacterized protein n=1 Tax=Agrobacterium pusense TaxID=648995 RepID=A0A1S9EMD1_9HYPH|nr:hypothetical protein [Agrobacterium pusense]MBM7327929.1 hypothetical protein [Agrobacterium sp. S2]MCW8283439.1 hypothetical protein [Agrobacterium sp. InxBP2]PZU69980.1 MAG: hypothetical protein DI546_18820 [Rhizobium sp.]QSZ56948.1 hypothetical protein BTN45_07380 [Rhizobium sp. ZX09]RAL98624.1 hypothetical protein DOU54_05990 [Agrobacterium sp. MS2]RSC38347.1 hypothetical protein EGT36_14980 [Agrobacterium sp. FDAARGOS_525]TGR71536.1 hypothetical protein EN837_09065 [bacterium M00.F.C
MQKVKTGLDSGFKQVIREFHPDFLFGADRWMAERRYIAGNYAYICLTGKFGQLPQETTGGALESAAGKTQCVRKIATRRGSALQYSASIGYMPGRVREVR